MKQRSTVWLKARATLLEPFWMLTKWRWTFPPSSLKQVSLVEAVAKEKQATAVRSRLCGSGWWFRGCDQSSFDPDRWLVYLYAPGTRRHHSSLQAKQASVALWKTW